MHLYIWDGYVILGFSDFNNSDSASQWMPDNAEPSLFKFWNKFLLQIVFRNGAHYDDDFNYQICCVHLRRICYRRFLRFQQLRLGFKKNPDKTEPSLFKSCNKLLQIVLRNGAHLWGLLNEELGDPQWGWHWWSWRHWRQNCLVFKVSQHEITEIVFCPFFTLSFFIACNSWIDSHSEFERWRGEPFCL